MRYEDLCLKTNKTVDTLLDFLDLSRHELIEKFISMNTHENPKLLKRGRLLWSTKRNSKYMAFEWRKHINNNHISKVQTFCAKSMKILGYNPMKNVSIDKFDDRYPLLLRPRLKVKI